jgi:hypothetical protein
VKRRVKASSAGSTLSRGAGLGSLRRAFATRSASSGVGGSGASSHCAGIGALALAAVAVGLILLAVAPIAAAKVVVGGFGTDAPVRERKVALGGQFAAFGVPNGEPRGIAVNSSGNGAPAGTTYVVDGLGNRIERFDPTGAFQRLWGQDAIASSLDETQLVTVEASAGTFTLSFNGDTTDPISFDGGGAEIQSVIEEALAGLPSVGGKANIEVSLPFDGSFSVAVAFKGALAATDLPQITADTSQLTGTVRISTAVDGHTVPEDTGSGFEICTVAADCKAGSISSTSANGGQLNQPKGIAIDQATGNVYVTELSNLRVSEFDPNGNFIRAFGWDVISTGKPNDNGTGFEICDTTAAIPDAITDCKRGASGANGGEFATLGVPSGNLTVDSSGNIWVTDTGNRRIQKFDSTGNFLAAYGYDVIPTGKPGDTGVGLEACPASASATAGNCRAGQTTNGGANPGQFDEFSPADLAFDSAGNLYAIDFGNFITGHHRVEKFDASSGYTTASDFATSTFANYTSKGPEHLVATQGGTRLDFSVQNDVSGGGEFQLIELDPTSPAAPTDTSLVGAGLTAGIGNGALNGLAYNSTTGDLYATSSIGASPRPVLILNSTPNPAPAVTVKSPSGVTDTSVDLAASVDPQGGLLSNCTFQYSIDQLNWTDVNEPDCSSLASSGIQLLGEHLIGLTPNTHYYARFQAARPLVPNSAVTSAVRSFDTASVPPVVTDVGAVQVADNSARLVGTIDPRNSATGYVFEYGTTPALGHTTEPLDVGGGSTPITVSQLIGGLAQDTTYYFKLVATNGFGSTSSDQSTLHTRAVPFPPASPGSCPNEAVRVAQGTTYLPDCRAYEMVTPPEKNQGGAVQGIGSYPVYSPDGNSAAFCTSAIFGEPPPQQVGACSPYVSRRGPGGWSTSAPFPRFCRNDRENGANQGRADYQLSPNFERAVIEQAELPGCPFPQLTPGAPSPARNMYRMDLTTSPFSYDLLAPVNAAHTTEAPTAYIQGGSEDFSHVVFTSFANQSADAPTPQDTSLLKVYDWHDGEAHLVSRDTNNQPFLTPSDYWGRTPAIGVAWPNPSGVSASGERIYFANPVPPDNFGTGPDGYPETGGCVDPGCDIYMREGDTVTYDVSEGECSSGCGPSHSPDRLEWASKEGNAAFFFSCDALTDSSTPFDTSKADCEGNRGLDAGKGSLDGEQAKLYRWDESLPPGHRLVDLTADHEPADGSLPRYKDLIGFSSDENADPESDAAPGNTAYFVARGQIVSGAPTDEGLKLYRWRWNGGAPGVDYIGPYLSSGPNEEVNDPLHVSFLRGDLNRALEYAHVNTDGRYLAINSKLRLDLASDHDSAADLYRWDEADGWTCISCQAPGIPSLGGADSSRHHASFEPNSPSASLNVVQNDFGLSGDGQRIVFTTPDALLPEDVNGEPGCPTVGVGTIFAAYVCLDIYEWHDGTLSLITPGTGAEQYNLIGTTAEGDVFFDTSRRLVGWDNDNASDVYVARIDGGFPEPPAQPPSCEGESCRGEGTLAANGVGASTAVFQGPGNPAPKHRKAGKPRKHKKHHKRASHKRANHNRRAGR